MNIVINIIIQVLTLSVYSGMDKQMVIEEIKLLEKHGGKSGNIINT